jgi:hypothetical protein
VANIPAKPRPKFEHDLALTDQRKDRGHCHEQNDRDQRLVDKITFGNLVIFLFRETRETGKAQHVAAKVCADRQGREGGKAIVVDVKKSECERGKSQSQRHPRKPAHSPPEHEIDRGREYQHAAAHQQQCEKD